MTIRLPRLLDAECREKCRLHPSRLSLSLRLSPLSTAEMILPWSEPAVAIRDLVELYDEQGSVGVFRVSAVEEEVGLTRRVHLEHGLATLSDAAIVATVFDDPVRKCLQYLLMQQPVDMWQLGDVDLPEDLVLLYQSGHMNLLTALLDIVRLLPEGMAPVFDQRELPWTLHLRRLNDADACEGRLTRNLSGVQITTDSSGLCTRVYPYGAGEGAARIDLAPLTGSNYLQSDAAETWGVISRTFFDGSIFTAELLRDVGLRYLERHDTPTVSVTAEAVDLSAVTGESLDSFRLGRMCRLTLPDRDVCLNERIIALDRPDVFASPGLVKLTLCNRIGDASDEIADMLRQSASNTTIGGKVRSIVTSSRGNGSYKEPIEHFFRIEKGQTVLSLTATVDPDEGVELGSVLLDGFEVPLEDVTTAGIDLKGRLPLAPTGGIAIGRHALLIFPKASGAVHSTVTLRVITAV